MKNIVLDIKLLLAMFLAWMFCSGEASGIAELIDDTTTEDVLALAEQHAEEAQSEAAGKYGNKTHMNLLIDRLNATEKELIGMCATIPEDVVAEELKRSSLSCDAQVSAKLSAAREDIVTMRDIDIDSNIIILFGRYWRPNACLGGQAFGAPAYGSYKCFSIDQNVTIHGIWPSSSNTSSFPNPVNCSDPSDLKPTDFANTSLVKELHKNWVSYYPIWNNFQFWQWEWFKHGSCWNKTKLEFFQLALDWHNKFDVPAIMKDQGIEPNKMVKRDEVLQKLTSKMWGRRMGLLCVENGTYVDQIFSCWDYSGITPIGCPPVSQCNDEVMFRLYQVSAMNVEVTTTLPVNSNVTANVTACVQTTPPETTSSTSYEYDARYAIHSSLIALFVSCALFVLV